MLKADCKNVCNDRQLGKCGWGKWAVWGNFPRKLGVTCTRELLGTPLGGLVDTQDAESGL